MDTVSGIEGKAIVTARAAGNITVQFFDNASCNACFKRILYLETLKYFVYGSAYSKGRNTDGTGADAKLEFLLILLSHSTANSPVIIRSSIPS